MIIIIMIIVIIIIIISDNITQAERKCIMKIVLNSLRCYCGEILCGNLGKIYKCHNSSYHFYMMIIMMTIIIIIIIIIKMIIRPKLSRQRKINIFLHIK